MAAETKKRVIIPGLRWWIIVLLFSAAVLNDVDQQTLSALAPTVQADLHMDDRESANIVNMFLVAFTIAYLISGRITDKMGTMAGMEQKGIASAKSRMGMMPGWACLLPISPFVAKAAGLDSAMTLAACAVIASLAWLLLYFGRVHLPRTTH